MNKNKFYLLSVMSFYIAAGVFACAFFFFRGSSLSGNEGSSLSVFNNIEPELSQSVLPEASDAVSEAASVEATPEPEPEPVYYAFTTLNIHSSLHVRQEPGLEARIIARFSPGTTGYVLEQGSTWSLVRSGDITGYVSNEYLDLQEIPKEEYPSP